MNAPVTVDYGPEEAAMRAYLAAGERRAFALGNRGPIRFTADGTVHPDILDAYWRCGFYVFEGVLGAEELADIEADIKTTCWLACRSRKARRWMPRAVRRSART